MILLLFIAVIVCPLLFIHAIIFELEELRQFSVLLFLFMIIGMITSTINV